MTKDLDGKMANYTPCFKTSENKLIQMFQATDVQIAQEDWGVLLSFGEILPDHAVLHSLLLMIPDFQDPSAATVDELCVEFNDQMNARFGNQIAIIHLTLDSLQIQFSEGAEISSGRVSYTAEADPFNRQDDPPPQKINGVSIFFALPLDLHSMLSNELTMLARHFSRVVISEAKGA